MSKNISISNQEKNQSKGKLCECGCGKVVTWNRNLKKWNTRLRGHNMVGVKRPKEIGLKIAKALKGRKCSEEFRLKMKIIRIDQLFANDNKWKYQNWRCITPAIKERDKNKCVICASKKFLNVHHIDSDPKNSEPLNLVTLCRSCHNKIHYQKNKIRIEKMNKIIKTYVGGEWK
jgi:hypothetical protein